MKPFFPASGILRPAAGKGGKWTERELKALKADLAGRVLGDGDGMVGDIRVGADGVISVRFRYQFRWDGKSKWYPIGTWPGESLKDLRERRDAARQQVKQGINPIERKQADKIEAAQETREILEAEVRRQAEEASLEALYLNWIEHGVKRADGNAEIKRAFEKDVLPPLGARPVSSITEDDIRSVLKAIVARGSNRMAVTVCRDLQQMLSWAEKRKPWRRLLQEGNPAALIEIEKIVADDYDMDDERDRVLSENEILQLHQIFRRMERSYCDAPAGSKYGTPRPLKSTSEHALWICLSTLSRIGETLMAEWQHIDLDRRIWTIPKENVKGAKGKKQAHTIYLSDFAHGQFLQLKALTGKDAIGNPCRWVFPATQAEGHVSVKSVTKQVADRQVMFKDRAKPLKGRQHDNSLVLPGGEWKPHDMRRTGATMMQSLRDAHGKRISLDVIDRCQNHVLAGSKVRRSYLHHDYADEMLEAWRLHGERLASIIDKEFEPPSNAPTGPAG